MLLAAVTTGQVTGVDTSRALLDVALSRAGGGDNIRLVHGDAARWAPPPRREPDLLVSRHGVMFFEDPVAAFSSLRDNAAPHARLAFSTFRARTQNGWATTLDRVFGSADDLPESTAPGPFAFGHKDHVARILCDAGWRNIEFETVDYDMVAGEGAKALDEATAYFQRIGPAARRIAELDGAIKLQAVERLESVLETHLADGKVTLAAAAWLITASS